MPPNVPGQIYVPSFLLGSHHTRRPHLLANLLLIHDTRAVPSNRAFLGKYLYAQIQYERQPHGPFDPELGILRIPYRPADTSSKYGIQLDALRISNEGPTRDSMYDQTVDPRRLALSRSGSVVRTPIRSESDQPRQMGSSSCLEIGMPSKRRKTAPSGATSADESTIVVASPKGEGRPSSHENTPEGQTPSSACDDSQCSESGCGLQDTTMSIFHAAAVASSTICICQPSTYKKQNLSFTHITAGTTHVILPILRDSPQLVAFITIAKREIVILRPGGFDSRHQRWCKDRIEALTGQIGKQIPKISQDSWPSFDLPSQAQWDEKEYIVTPLLKCLRRILDMESKGDVSSRGATTSHPPPADLTLSPQFDGLVAQYKKFRARLLIVAEITKIFDKSIADAVIDASSFYVHNPVVFGSPDRLNTLSLSSTHIVPLYREGVSSVAIISPTAKRVEVFHPDMSKRWCRDRINSISPEK